MAILLVVVANLVPLHQGSDSGVASSKIEGVHIHMIVFTDQKNNRFQKRLIMQNTNI